MSFIIKNIFIFFVLFSNTLFSSQQKNITKEKFEEIKKLAENEEKTIKASVAIKFYEFINQIIDEVQKSFTKDQIQKVLEHFDEVNLNQLIIEKLLRYKNDSQHTEDYNYILENLSNEKLQKLLLSWYMGRLFVNPRDLENFQRLINMGADVNFIDHKYWHPLLYSALITANYDLTKMFLENQADPNTNMGAYSILQIAIIKNLALKKINVLIDYGADVNYQNLGSYNRTPLMFAVLEINPRKIMDVNNFAQLKTINSEVEQTVYTLLMAGADPNLKDLFGLSFKDYIGNNEILNNILKNVAIEKAKRKQEIMQITNIPKDVVGIITEYLG